MSKVIAHDTFHTILDEDGTGEYIVVEVETNPGEHHMTNRAAARAFLAAHMPDNYALHQYIGTSHYRRGGGYHVTARVYSVVNTAH